MSDKPILEIKDLVVKFLTSNGKIHACNKVNISLNEGESLGVVGESGCGKSVSMLSILRLIPDPPGKIESGEILYRGQDLLKLSDREIRDVRGKRIAMIFQDPIASLNPVFTVGRQVAEPLKRHFKYSNTMANEKAQELLSLVGIANAKKRMKEYPHQFSGGMRQRVMIAMSLACNPDILIADEPTTALDVTIQAQIMDLIEEIRSNMGMAVIWISHDLGVVSNLVDRVVVMYAGFVIENLPVSELINDPQHPYTIGLLGSLPKMDKRIHGLKLSTIPGSPPVLWNYPTGCAFKKRCLFAMDICDQSPPLIKITDSHQVACWVDPATGRLR